MTINTLAMLFALVTWFYSLLTLFAPQGLVKLHLLQTTVTLFLSNNLLGYEYVKYRHDNDVLLSPIRRICMIWVPWIISLEISKSFSFFCSEVLPNHQATRQKFFLESVGHNSFRKYPLAPSYHLRGYMDCLGVGNKAKYNNDK